MSTDVSREKAVFCQALEISDPGQRRQFLDNACSADKELRHRVEGLLALSPGAGDFFDECRPALESPAADAEQVLSAAESALKPEPPETKCIGPYKLLQKLGEGGYGVVYMAEQEQPIRRRVALKIIKLGMDTRNVIARFEAERQALALMDHPNIARVLDAGATENGRPYFVMELVYGVKITDYCDRNRVGMKERLELFVQVCHAVQHAHQKGIVHRDLKPSNIMVTMHDGVPVPKVIDFGIAKATEQRLTDKTLFTSYAQLMGTPAYMSPEQMELSGLNLDTRSDIYSLGVLLYELLTGRTPFDTTELLKGGVEELRRTICERDPLSPSAKLQTLNKEELTKTARRLHVEALRLVSQLRGDLDWIVLKCLEKDRTRRYPTANALAMDIERYRHEEAVKARPPSQLYKLQKLVRRNRMVFLSGATAATALLLGTVVSTLLFFSEARLRQEAESRAKGSRVAQLVTQRRFEEADRLLAQVPLRPSIELAAELRALGDWYAAKRAWRQAAERFSSLVVADQLDDPAVASLDQLKFAAALLEAGDHPKYEEFRRGLISKFLPAQSSLPVPALKACLLRPLESNLLRSLLSALGPAANGSSSSLETPTTACYAIQWSDAMALLEYRRGNFSNTVYQPYRLGNPAGFATSCFIEAANRWQLKDYWGAMTELARGYEMFLVGAKPRPGAVGSGADIFPGLADFVHVEGSWYEWAVGDLLMRELSETITQAERSVDRISGRVPSLEQLAIIRGAGEWHALNGDWAQSLLSARFCVQSSKQDTADHATTDYFNAAIASLKIGDQNGYLHLREEMISRFKGTDQAFRILHIALLAPIDQQTALRLEPFAAAVTRDIQNGSEGNPWNPIVLALLNYRRAQYTNAMDTARRSVANVRQALPNAMVSVLSGLCLSQLGHSSAARSELDRAESLIHGGFDFDYDMWWWRHWVSLRLLLAEAQACLRQAPPHQPGVHSHMEK